jgi:hypothetical protein
MPPQNVILHSAPLKGPIKAALIEVNKAIAQGQAAVQKSQAAVTANPTQEEKLKLRQNQELLAKAEFLKSGLESSEKIANFMCPLQVAMLEFDYI